ncbi:uncharacterized protein LOC132912105 isoform X1 [Bombus pascuorum]|uniref:uncharacterized protein LOC132912105 isoform X1 n=1 Tax=Bombus pascuorum TaxID=65598 RepID=UPI00298E58FD|nr:uncharacterized protein LOC132912105 isoform X1 [Bombus pascuorum]XP_060825211.1 uncharacterized protein LOC132912105 isoform X1 [Bombus pascuorum]XP_060825220.1 uncharacterized protein LOC132912105 isoform X1 [Bombus pascuorum]XP_060825230.1 uncharacterized protein LOC132912105 isoform X1 [Bombus pascuorum]
MTEEMNNTVSCKWTMEEREKMLTTGTLEQQREAFKDDEELMRETSKFVSEVIQTAITEASKRKVLTEKAVSEGSRLKGIGNVAGWNHRARGFCSRILNALCPCFTSNELFTWTPYRYRFTRP